jgi:hypothetical protein
MNYDALPQFILAKLLALDEAAEALSVRAGAIERDIENRRARRYGNLQRADDNPRLLEAELEKLLADQNVVRQRLQAEQSVLSACKAWVDRLPVGKKLEQVNPEVQDGLSLPAVRARIKKLWNEVEALKRVPIPAPNIREIVRTYVQDMTRPVIDGIGSREMLSVRWPTGLHALMAFLQPDLLVERLMTEIDWIANTPCPLAQREQQIAELEDQIDRLQRAEEAIVVATGAPREAGCPAWVVLGVKAVEARGVRAA